MAGADGDVPDPFRSRLPGSGAGSSAAADRVLRLGGTHGLVAHRGFLSQSGCGGCSRGCGDQLSTEPALPDHVSIPRRHHGTPGTAALDVDATRDLPDLGQLSRRLFYGLGDDWRLLSRLVDPSCTLARTARAVVC